MHELSLTLRTVSPLSLHADRSSRQFAVSADYIPGSALRGALAAQYLAGEAGRAQDTAFQQLFLEDRVHFPDLLPADNPGKPWTLLPATAYGCKRFPKEHGAAVTDMLLRLELADTLMVQGREHWRQPLVEVEACPDCQGKYPGSAGAHPRDRLSLGYASSWRDFFAGGEVHERLLTGTAIDRATGTAAPAMLFSQKVIERGQFFAGRVRIAGEMPPAAVDMLRTTLAPASASLYLGRGRTRGLGQVQVVAWDEVKPLTKDELTQRFGRLNAVAAKLWQVYGAGVLDSDFFTLTLQSHLALVDALGRPLLDDLTPESLGIPWASWGRRVLAPVAAGGWNAAWGLPKHETWALGRGGVILGRVARADRARTLEALETLAAEGGGLRRAEGLGRIEVCAPFHYELTRRELN